MNIYVGNLAASVTDDDLRQAFAAYGQVSSAQVIKDRISGTSRGFGFVEMPVNAEAQAAIVALSGQEMQGRKLTVNESRTKAEGGRSRGTYYR